MGGVDPRACPWPNMPKLDKEKFDLLIERVRSGEAEAAEEFVRLYEPEIRREIRLRLTDRHLRRTLDSTDICQSVLGNFFVRTSLGQIDFDRPGQLVRLLSTMARNKVIDRHRKEKVRRTINGASPDSPGSTARVSDYDPPDRGESPSKIVAGKELADLLNSKLTEEEKQIAQFRKDGLSWLEIGERLNASGEALRKRLSRSCSRILEELGLDEAPDS